MDAQAFLNTMTAEQNKDYREQVRQFIVGLIDDYVECEDAIHLCMRSEEGPLSKESLVFIRQVMLDAWRLEQGV